MKFNTLQSLTLKVNYALTLGAMLAASNYTLKTGLRPAEHMFTETGLVEVEVQLVGPTDGLISGDAAEEEFARLEQRSGNHAEMVALGAYFPGLLKTYRIHSVGAVLPYNANRILALGGSEAAPELTDHWKNIHYREQDVFLIIGSTTSV